MIHILTKMYSFLLFECKNNGRRCTKNSIKRNINIKTVFAFQSSGWVFELNRILRTHQSHDCSMVL